MEFDKEKFESTVRERLAGRSYVEQVETLIEKLVIAEGEIHTRRLKHPYRMGADPLSVEVEQHAANEAAKLGIEVNRLREQNAQLLRQWEVSCKAVEENFQLRASVLALTAKENQLGIFARAWRWLFGSGSQPDPKDP